MYELLNISYVCIVNQFTVYIQALTIFLHYSLQGFKVYAVLMYTLLVPHRFLATGDAMTTIAYNFRIGVSTARQLILDVCIAIWDALASIHLPVPSKAEWHSIAKDFYVRWNFPNCIGAIDGKHIMIQCLSNSGSLFFNYKSYFSIVLLVVALADYRFVMVDIGAYRSSNDSGVLKTYSSFQVPKEEETWNTPI